MRPKKTSSPPTRAASLKAAASMLDYPPAWISKAKAAGCEGFNAKGSVLLAPVKAWIEAHMDELMAAKEELSLRDQKLAEEVRKLRLRNDRDAGKLVELSWITERFHRLAGEINSIRTKSEQEDAVRFAEALGDVAKCRTVLRGIWDNIMAQHQACAKHFEQ